MLSEISSSFTCPSCGEENFFQLDISAGRAQEWISDCEVCCRPLVVSIELDGEKLARLEVKNEHE